MVDKSYCFELSIVSGCRSNLVLLTIESQAVQYTQCSLMNFLARIAIRAVKRRSM